MLYIFTSGLLLLQIQTKDDVCYKPDHEWVQCDKCRKWRMLSNGFDSESLPAVWYSLSLSLVRAQSIIFSW